MLNDSNSFYVVLGILNLGAKSGYDIKKTIENQIGHFYKISNGQIYPALKKLIGGDLATLTIEKTDGKPDRKVYTITEKGVELFNVWLSSPINFSNPNGNEFLLKLYFGSTSSIQQNIELISNFRLMKEKYLNVFNQISENFNMDKIKNLPGYYSYFTLRYGQILAQANIDWCNEVLNALQKLDANS